MQGYDSYKSTDIETASQLKLIVMLYNGALKFIDLAVESMKNNEMDKAHYNAIRAQDIVGELLSSLNFDAGDIADRLSGLYIYINKLLVEGNIKKDPSLLLEASELLHDLKSGWDELLSQEDSSQNNAIKNINISG